MGATNTQPIQTQVTPTPAPPIPQAPQQPTSMPSWFTGNAGGMGQQQPQVAPTMSPAVMQEPKMFPSAGGPSSGFHPVAGGLPPGGAGVGIAPPLQMPTTTMTIPPMGGPNGGQPGPGGPKAGGCGHNSGPTAGGWVAPQTLFSM